MQSLIIKNLGHQDYEPVYLKMSEYTLARDQNSEDMLWCVEHPTVFTQGKHGRPEHLINPHNIPVIQSDRGGQITYHGPGQAVIYFLIDLQRRKIGIKHLVCTIEKSCIEMLAKYGIQASTLEGAPGIYVNGKKIASLGLRVKHKRTYHGIAINTDMDLTPFSYINPCGYQGLEMCQIKDFNADITLNQVFADYTRIFTQRLNA